jgi:hypothetical protein
MHWSFCLHKNTLAVLALMGTAAFSISSARAQEQQLTFSFPGSDTKIPSGSRQLTATYKELPSPPDAANEYELDIVNRSGTDLVQHFFTRSVQGTWSPRSDNVFVNDYLGSTQIDCLVWQKSKSSHKFVSLTDLLIHDPHSGPVQGRGVKPPETPQNSRYELVCKSWDAGDNIKLELSGNTWAGGHFDYRLIYNALTRRFSWN